MQYPIPHSNSTQTIESLEQPNWKTLQESRYPVVSPATFQVLAEKSFSLQSYHRHSI